MASSVVAYPARRRFRTVLLAGAAALPLLTAPALALDERLDPTEALSLHEQTQAAAGALLDRVAAQLADEALPRPAGELTLPDVPPEFAAQILAHDAVQAPVSTAALSHIPPRQVQPLTPGVAAQRSEEPPLAVVASGELFDPGMILRPTVPAAPPGDLALVRQAISEHQRGNRSLGDALAEKIDDPAARLAVDWVTIRNAKQTAGFRRLTDFLARNPDFPMAEWVRKRAEEALYIEKPGAETVTVFFRDRMPETAPGLIALARVRLAIGDTGSAHALIRQAWRDGRTNAGIRATIAKEFAGVITLADQRYLAHRLIYDGATGEGLRVAASLPAPQRQLAEILAGSVNETGGDPARIDPAVQKDGAAAFVRVQHLRRTGKIAEAGRALLSAPQDAEAIVDGDEWWIERRMIVRKLLDAGDSAGAYRAAAEHGAEASHYIVDAEVHAGWVALRFLNDAQKALPHFDLAAVAAEAPASLARAHYWRGRALEALGADPALAYRQAASHRHAYHGQLAMERLGERVMPDLAAAIDPSRLEEVSRRPALRAIRVLLDSDAVDLAQPLVIELARNAEDLETSMALGDLVARYGLPRLTVLAGKMAMQKGLKAEEHAFPTFGIPPYDPVDGSAEAAIVYSIARQESEFEAKAVSHAGARGLMQLMPATARRTASRFRIPLDVNRLTQDAALNARIGAAHLGELFGEYNGSYVLSFAAYNAGGRRVKEWTTAYGDPRQPNVDVVDWIERIPITETRHYVQKILENVQVYRVKLAGSRQLGLAADMRRGARIPQDPMLAHIVKVPPVPRHDAVMMALGAP